MGKLLLVLLLAVVACGGDNTSADDETLVEMCVRRTDEIYKKHDLPYTRPKSEGPQLCEEYLTDNNIETKAQFEVQMRALDKELSALDD